MALLLRGGAQGVAFAEAEEKERETLVMRPDKVSPLPYATARILERARPSKPFLLRIEGKSMLPFIPPGSAVKVEPLGAPPRIGDVVVRVDSSGTIAHRVVRRHRLRRSQGVTVVTKGDNALRLDPPCAAADIVGIVRRVHRYGDDGKSCIKALPRLSGLWIARLSCLLGVVSGALPRRIYRGRKGKPRKTVAWLILAVSQRFIRGTIYFISRDFRPGIMACSRLAVPVLKVLAAGSSYCGKTASR